MDLPKNATIRINLAWIKSLEEARNLIEQSDHDIYLDYPTGRTKPPQPKITLEEAIELTKLKRVKYFATSNVEDAETCDRISQKIDVKFIPKIETQKGVLNLHKMIRAGVDTIMLDKEDLYIDVNKDQETYQNLIDLARSYDIRVLELQGVVFI